MAERQLMVSKSTGPARLEHAITQPEPEPEQEIVQAELPEQETVQADQQLEKIEPTNQQVELEQQLEKIEPTNEQVELEPETEQADGGEHPIQDGRHSGMPLPIVLLAMIGGIMIGFALSFPGGLANMDMFLHRFSRSIFIATKTGISTNFCHYFNPWFLQFLLLIPLCAVPSIWMAFTFASIWGRRPVLVIGSLCWALGSCLAAWDPMTSVGVVGMIFLGLGLGVTYQIIPIICSETVPPKSKKRINIIFQYMIQLGHVLACTVNYVAAPYPGWGWRLPFVSIVFLCVLLLIVTFQIRETPKWLFQHGYWVETEKELRNIRQWEAEVEAELESLAKEANQEKDQFKDFICLRSRPKLLISTASQFLPPLIGIETLVFFSPLLLDSLVHTFHQTFLGPLVANVCRIVSSSTSHYFSDRIGRRIPVMVSCFAIFIAQLIVWIVFHKDPLYVYVDLKKPDATCVKVFMLLTVIAFSVVSAPYGWTNDNYHGESSILGAAWESSISMAMTVVMGHITLRLLCALSDGMFFFMGGVALLIACFVFFFVPETTGVQENEMPVRIWGVHRYWKRYFPVDRGDSL